MKWTGILQYRIFLLALFAGVGLGGFAQEVDDYDDILQRVDTVENPVYLPVLSISYGSLNFFGDVRNSNRLPVVGNPAIKVNVATFIDNKQYFSANFYFLTGDRKRHV